MDSKENNNLSTQIAKGIIKAQLFMFGMSIAFMVILSFLVARIEKKNESKKLEEQP